MLLLLNYVVLRALWKIDVHLILSLIKVYIIRLIIETEQNRMATVTPTSYVDIC